MGSQFSNEEWRSLIDHVVPEGLFSDNVSLGVEKPDLEDAVHNEELAFVVGVVLW